MDATAQQLLARLRQNPTDGATLSALSAHCEQMGDYASLIESLEQQARKLAEADGDPLEISRIHFDLGNLFRAHKNRVDRAIVHYRAAIDYDAAQRPAMAAARAIYSDLGKWDQVVKLLGREAESLPPGAKRATVLTELARIYRDKLGQIEQATQALREAATADPEDLQVRHDLATLLLDRADRETDLEIADEQRREAADVLCEMAASVGDEYAFAYVEAALDAVPDHGPGLKILEKVAPRVGRADTIPPRWVAGLQMAPLGPLSRGLRLKLAEAYRDVGQTDDARACLDPLLKTHDPEATELAASLSAVLAAAKKQDLAGPTGEVSLDDIEMIESEVKSSLADDLAALAARDSEDESSAQRLSDLAIVKPASSSPEPEGIDLLSSVETAIPADVLGADDAEDSDGDLHGEETRPRAAMDTDPSELAPNVLEQTPQVPLDQASLMSELKSADAARAERRDADATPVSLAPAADLLKLRSDLEKRRKFRDLRGASEIAEAILAHDPTDADAISALEDHYRASRDFRRMRELALRIAREPAMAVEVRVTRLREASMLSESKLGDVEGTINAWRDLLLLAPHDEEGNIKLRKLLTRHQRWDELAQVLDKQAMAIVDPEPRATVYRELAILHRDKRNNFDDAIEALSSVRDLMPDQPDDEALLSELLLKAERFAEASTLYEARLVRAEDDSEKLTLMKVLADLYEKHLSDDERAHEVSQQILRIRGHDTEALARMERIDERLSRFDRLIGTLLTRAESTQGKARAELLTRCAELARTRLSDLPRATELYAEAFGFAPGDPTLIEAAEVAFDEAGRGAALTQMLAAQAEHAREKATRIFLQRKIAKRLSGAQDLDAAITAHQALLALEVEVDTLRALVALLQRAEGREAELVQQLDALALRVEPAEARDLRFQRATLLSHTLKDPEAAKTELRRILRELSNRDIAALERLAELGQETQDLACVAEAKELLLPLAATDEGRVEIAQSLADLYEGDLKDPAKAITALDVWASLDLANPQPYLRLVPLLEQQGKFAELRGALDTLATLSIADDEAAEFLLRAAKVSMTDIGDHEGAWQRLVPRVVDAGDPAAEEALRELARVAGRGEQLAELFVGLAQRAEDDKAQTRRWMDAAYTYETMVGSNEKALEAALRALAKDMGSSILLDEVDRLAALAGAWPRLAQVYDAMARRGETVEARARALLRHASLLEQKAGDASAAFDRVALAFSLDPAANDVYAEVCRLGKVSSRLEDLLTLHERRAEAVPDTALKIAALIEACRLAQQELEDAPRATGALSRAVGLAGAEGEALDGIEQTVKKLDEASPALDGRGLTYALCEVYKLRGEEGHRDAKVAAELWYRAAVLLEREQEDHGGAYRALARAATLAPADEAILDALVAAAERANAFEALAAHFKQAADDAIDSNTASLALKRLGALYETPLASPHQAAQVYGQLVTLRPRDVEVADKLRGCLKAAGQFKELLVAIDRQLSLVTNPADRQPLLEEAAETWETGIKNRFEAKDAWRKVLAAFPESGAAIAALGRLDTKVRLDESDLLEGDLVVRPEDLRPTAPPEEPVVEPKAVVVSEPATVVVSEPAAVVVSDAEAGAEAAPVASQAGDHDTTIAFASSSPAASHAGDHDTTLEFTGRSAKAPDGPTLWAVSAEREAAAAAAGADAEGASTAQDTEAPLAMLADAHDDHEHASVDEAEYADANEFVHAGVTDPAPAPFAHMEDASGELEQVESADLSVEIAEVEQEPVAEEPDAQQEVPPAFVIPKLPAFPTSALLAELSGRDAGSDEEIEANDAELVESGTVELETVEPVLPVEAASLDALSNMLERGAIKTTPPTKGKIPPPPPSGAASVRPTAPPPPLPPRPSVPAPPAAARGSLPPPPDAPKGTVPPPPPRRNS